MSSRFTFINTKTPKTAAELNRLARNLHKQGRLFEQLPGESSRLKLYFAYGANTNLLAMVRRCPAAKPVCSARALGHSLVFRSVADIVPKPGESVPGALWWLTEACEKALDRFEGFPRLYTKKSVMVRVAPGTVRHAMVYVMNDSSYEAPPSEGYLRGIIGGYRDFGYSHEEVLWLMNRAGYEFTQNF